MAVASRPLLTKLTKHLLLVPFLVFALFPFYHMVVSMRPIPQSMVSKAVTASARYPNAHGAPVQVGDPASIGINDVTKPDWGDFVGIQPGEVPVFWACGVTPQAVALASRPEFMITHSPGHMFITDLPNHALAAL